MIEISEKELLSKLNDELAFAVYFFTPFCGTCAIAEKMLNVVMAVKEILPLFKCNVNYAPFLVRRWEISSVPCLILVRNGEIIAKESAMKSVDHLLQLLQLNELQ